MIGGVIYRFVSGPLSVADKQALAVTKMVGYRDLSKLIIMPTPQEQYDDAMYDFSMADYDSAIAKLKTALAADPDYFDAQRAARAHKSFVVLHEERGQEDGGASWFAGAHRVMEGKHDRTRGGGRSGIGDGQTAGADSQGG